MIRTGGCTAGVLMAVFSVAYIAPAAHGGTTLPDSFPVAALDFRRDVLELTAPIWIPMSAEDRSEISPSVLYMFVMTGDLSVEIAGERFTYRREYGSLRFRPDAGLNGAEYCMFSLHGEALLHGRWANTLLPGTVLGFDGTRRFPQNASAGIFSFPWTANTFDLSENSEGSPGFTSFFLQPAVDPTSLSERIFDIHCKLKGEDSTVGQVRDLMRGKVLFRRVR